MLMYLQQTNLKTMSQKQRCTYFGEGGVNIGHYQVMRFALALYIAIENLNYERFATER